MTVKKTVYSLFLAGLLAFSPAAVQAQDNVVEADNAVVATQQAVVADNAAAPTESVSAPVAAPERLKPVEGIGMPKPKELGFQEQFTETGKYARWINDVVLLPIIVAISVFVLFLLIYVIFRFRQSANPVPSKTSHNTAIEVAWTLIPVVILIGIAIPSIDLLAQQYKPAPKDALTVKVTGYQWYWGYEYPDNEVPEFVSNMLPAATAIANGEPELLAVDNRLVLPVGKPIKLLITAADVIHSFSVPAFWVKMDAVPGRINEKTFTIEKPGVYYGQCSELCGARHGFMPIAIEALPQAEFDQWLQSQGGKPMGAKPAEAAAVAAPAAATPAKI